MKWERVNTAHAFGEPRVSSYLSDDGRFRVHPRFERGRYKQRTKRVVYWLYENRRFIGNPFASARLARAFAEALADLGDDRQARREFIRNGAEWCWDKEREWRNARDERRWAQ